MARNRREILKSVAFGALGAGAACAPRDDGAQRSPPIQGAASSSNAITTTTIAEAEKLQGIRFDQRERAQMIETLESNLASLAQLRAQTPPNELAPALQFDPKLPGKRVASQKNRLRLAERPVPASPSSADELAFASVVDIGVWLRRGVISSRALTAIYLDRIERFDPALHAFITVTPEIALRAADKADRELSAGKDRGPLHGIPYGLKDLGDVAGVRTTWGATPYKDRVAATDCEVVRKLKRAGAVLLGKTSCGALAYGDQWYDAVTRNPWNPDEGSSGSSAGSASATAGGLCAFSIGTETLGSIIAPSERCGLAGLRPTYGRVSRAGFMALCWSLDKVGPICRFVEDAALVLAALNGFDADDPGAARMGFSYDGDMDLSGLTIGYDPAMMEEGDSVDVAALAAARVLGAAVKEVSMPALPMACLVQIVHVEAAAAFADLTLNNGDDALVWQEPEAWPNSFRAARFMSAVDYVQIDRLRRRVMAEMSALFERVDVLIGPHSARGALLATNCAGQPQLALRAGFAQTPTRDLFNARVEKGLGAQTFETPRNISLWADIFQEGPLLAVGRALEDALGLAGRRPPGF